MQSDRRKYKALNHALASGIDCIYSRRERQIMRSTKKHRGSERKVLLCQRGSLVPGTRLGFEPGAMDESKVEQGMGASYKGK